MDPKPESSELAQLKAEIADFIEHIADFLEPDCIPNYRIIAVGEFGTDGYTYYHDGNVANIIISPKLLEQRRAHIARWLDQSWGYSVVRILQSMYRHILSHECFHFSNQNLAAFDLIESCRLLSPSENKIVRQEEYAAEDFAIAESLRERDHFLVYLSILLETATRTIINRDNARDKTHRADDHHMPDAEILRRLYNDNFSETQKKVLAKIAEEAR